LDDRFDGVHRVLLGRMRPGWCVRLVSNIP
jgi:hypothetical protein